MNRAPVLHIRRSDSHSLKRVLARLATTETASLSTPPVRPPSLAVYTEILRANANDFEGDLVSTHDSA